MTGEALFTISNKVMIVYFIEQQALVIA